LCTNPPPHPSTCLMYPFYIQFAVVDSRFRVDVKAKIMPLVERFYGLGTEEVTGHGNLNWNREGVRNLKRNATFVDENGLPYRHPIIQQAINTIWFRDRHSHSEGDTVLILRHSPLVILI
jgi:hypothetical protein